MKTTSSPLTGDALLVSLDDRAWRAARRADALQLDPDRRRQAYLVEREAAFWRGLLADVEAGAVLTKDQTFALRWAATDGAKGVHEHG